MANRKLVINKNGLNPFNKNDGIKIGHNDFSDARVPFKTIIN
jgi:hypothetical protein